jgi:hypothetical protein
LVEAVRHRRWRELPGLTQPLRDLGLDDQGLLEVGHLISIFNYFPRMADGFGLKADPQFAEAARTGVPLRRAT